MLLLWLISFLLLLLKKKRHPRLWLVKVSYYFARVFIFYENYAMEFLWFVPVNQFYSYLLTVQHNYAVRNPRYSPVDIFIVIILIPWVCYNIAPLGRILVRASFESKVLRSSTWKYSLIKHRIDYNFDLCYSWACLRSILLIIISLNDLFAIENFIFAEFYAFNYCWYHVF